jgi:ubiquinone/menaquinone biosynthesis C-methylase UbiE
VHLAQNGYRVTAIDSSPAMVNEARDRVRTSSVGDRVDVHAVGIHELDRFGSRAPFDAAVSNFGPLNCIDDLPEAAERVAARLAGGVSSRP